jgi:hypothetical protein
LKMPPGTGAPHRRTASADQQRSLGSGTDCCT